MQKCIDRDDYVEKKAESPFFSSMWHSLSVNVLLVHKLQRRPPYDGRNISQENLDVATPGQPIKPGTRNAWRLPFTSCANGSLKSVRVRLATWQKNSMTRVYKKCHGICKSAPIAMITSKNSWESSLSINVTFIVNKRVFYVKKIGNLILWTHFIVIMGGRK